MIPGSFFFLLFPSVRYAVRYALWNIILILARAYFSSGSPSKTTTSYLWGAIVNRTKHILSAKDENIYLVVFCFYRGSFELWSPAIHINSIVSLLSTTEFWFNFVVMKNDTAWLIILVLYIHP